MLSFKLNVFETIAINKQDFHAHDILEAMKNPILTQDERFSPHFSCVDHTSNLLNS